MVINEKGLFRLDANTRWQFEEAPRRGLRDPWDHRPNRPIRTEEVLSIICGKEIPATKTIYNECTDEELSAWKAERDSYMRQRDEWLALEVFHAFGYEAFLEDAWNLSEEFKNSIYPCDSQSDSQCTMYCPKYFDCERR